MPVSPFYKFQSKPLKDDNEIDLMGGIDLPEDEPRPAYRGPVRPAAQMEDVAAAPMTAMPKVEDQPEMVETTLADDETPDLDSKEGLFAALSSRYPDLAGVRQQRRAEKPDLGMEGVFFEAASRAASAAGAVGGKQAESGAGRLVESYRQAERQKAKDLIDDESLAASEISGFARNFIRTNLGVDVPETVTAAQLKTFMPAITQQYLAQKRAEQAERVQESQMQRIAETAGKASERLTAQQEFMAEQKRLDREQREREAKMRAEKPEKTIGGVGADVAKVEMDLAKQFRADKTVQAHQLMQNEMRQLEALAAEGNPQSDQALITKFAKILDPGSVVRETEFAITEKGGGVLTSLQNTLDKARGTGRLQPSQRQQMLQAARSLTAGVSEEYKKKRQEYSQQGALYGARPEAIIGAEPVMPSAAAPLQSGGRSLDQIRAEKEAIRKQLEALKKGQGK
jgi:hypothetical protein